MFTQRKVELSGGAVVVRDRPAPQGKAGATWPSLRLSHAAIPRGTDALLLIAVLVFAVALIANLPGSFSVDTWLELMAGRAVWQHGIPSYEVLTVIDHGVRWVDQQWLAQLLSYWLYRVGGLGLLGTVDVGLLAGAVGGAIFAARRLGGRAPAVLAVLPLCAWLIVPSREVRTQAFALPLFVLLVYLLAADSRHPSRRVYWSLPVLVVWANLHGTVTLGAGLVALRGLTLLWERRHSLTSDAVAWRRPVLLMIGGALALLATPYTWHAVGYYHATLLNSSLKHAVTEWQPITSESLILWPFVLLAGIALWTFGRTRGATSLWERLALIALAAVSIDVIRNVVFFALCALITLPFAVQSTVHFSRPTGARDRRRLNSLALCAASVVCLFAVAASLTRPQRQYEYAYQRAGVLTAVRNTVGSDPGIQVLADVRFADWLLWRDPALAGRIANDARFELMTPAQIDQVRSVFGVLGPDWRSGARGYRLIVLDRQADPQAAQGFLAEPGRRVLYDDGRRMVILRSARAAA